MIPPATFFALVDAHVTVPMVAADYAELGEVDEVTRDHAVVLSRGGWLGATPRLRFWLARARAPRARVLSVGYEGDHDEKWISYRPGSAELDVTSWCGELDGQADLDAFGDRTVETVDELERRLQVVGAVMQGRAGPGPSPQ